MGKDDEHSGHVLSEAKTGSKETDLMADACLRMEASHPLRMERGDLVRGGRLARKPGWKGARV